MQMHRRVGHQQEAGEAGTGEAKLGGGSCRVGVKGPPGQTSSPRACVRWAGLTWVRDVQSKVQTWSISVTQVPVSNANSSPLCIRFLGRL